MSARYSLLAALFYASSLSGIACSSQLPEQINAQPGSLAPVSNSTNITMINDENLFQQVPLDTNEQTSCSPADPGFDWRGVVIRAPSRVVLPEKSLQHSPLIIPICGLYLVDVANISRHPGPKIAVVADEVLGQVYKGELIKRRREPTIPRPPSPPLDPSANLAFGDYFNVNIAAYVTLPLQPARYRVKIEYAGYHSNEVTIVVVERP
jgi:hypothetical protein